MIIRWPVGGIKSYLQYIYPKLSSKYNFIILCPDLDLDDFFIKNLPKNIIYMKSKNSNISLFLKMIISFFKYKVKIVHAHGYSAGIVAIFSKLFAKKLLITCHDVFFQKMFQGRFIYKYYLLKLSFLFTNKILPVGFDCKNNLKKFFNIKNKKIKTIRNGIEIKPIKQAKKIHNLKLELNILPSTKTIGFLGRFMAQKGFSTILDAVLILKKENITNIKILLTTNGGFLKQELEKIKQLKLDNYFLFIGQKYNVYSLLKSLDLLLIPSRWEAMPLLAMEASLTKTPIIATKAIGLKEALKKSPATMIKINDAKNLAKEIKKNLQNKKAKQKAKNFYQTAKNIFSNKKHIYQLDKIYQENL